MVKAVVNKIASIVSNSGAITLFINNKSFVVARQHLNYDKIKKALVDKNYDVLPDLVDLDNSINRFAKGKVEVKNGYVYFNGAPLHNVLVDRILNLQSEGFAFDSMARFLENLMMNPNDRSREQVYQFLEHKNLPITPEGNFLAYKCVRSDLYDKHSQTIKNYVGAVIQMDRSKVSDNPGLDCSYGLHVGSLEYSGPGGFFNNNSDDVVLVVEVNPKDVVSVPNDHSCQKMRVCEYKVIDIYQHSWPNRMEQAVSSTYNHDEYMRNKEIEEVKERGYDDGYYDRSYINDYEDCEYLYDAYEEAYADGQEEREIEEDEEDNDCDCEYCSDDYDDEEYSEEDEVYEAGYADGSRRYPSDESNYSRGYAQYYRDGYKAGFNSTLTKATKKSNGPKRDANGRFCK